MAAILILDDQATSRQLIRKLLESMDPSADVVDFADGVQALEWLSRSPVDLVLADYSMPGMDGLAFTRKFRRQPQHRDVPLVFITISDEQEVRLEALDAGATDFLNKPVDHYELKARCNNLLKLRRYQLSLKERAAGLEASLIETRGMIDERERDTVATLAAVLQLSSVATQGRIRRVSELVRQIAANAGYDDDDANELAVAARLADLGRLVRTASESPAGTTASEHRQQAEALASVLAASASRFARRAGRFLPHLEEHFDGSGQPQGLAGASISRDARVVAVALAVEARLCHSGNRLPLSVEGLFEWAEDQSGTRLDPEAVTALARAMAQVRNIYSG